MTVETAYRFDAMYKASGGILKITSAFRTVKRQWYFWNSRCCVRGKGCSCGEPAAYPGTSRHGVGVALDIATNCGSGGTISRPPSLCWQSNVYRWLDRNAQNYGFRRTVNS